MADEQIFGTDDGQLPAFPERIDVDLIPRPHRLGMGIVARNDEVDAAYRWCDGGMLKRGLESSA